MKKSTIIMIAMAVVCWIAILAAVAYETTNGIPLPDRNIVIPENSPVYSQPLKPFTEISFNDDKSDARRINIRNFAGLKIVVSDSVDAPVITAPQILKKYLVAENSGSILRMRLRIPPEDTIPSSPEYMRWPYVTGTTPIVITTPRTPTAISSTSVIPIALHGATGKLFSTVMANISLQSCNLDILSLRAANLYRNTTASAELNNSSARRLEVSAPTTVAKISGDSLSSISSIYWPTDSGGEINLNISNIRIGNISAPAATINTVSKNATIGSISSK
jgi:hypothetical protein